jgi:CheY-like chemotaxis protein
MEAHPQLRVLVIDDDPDLIALLTRGLHVFGHHEVVAATDGARGLERVYEVRPDCVVVDVRMPGLNGYQFVHALRGDAATASIPIVIVSALTQDRQQLAGMLTGADAYLIKPVRLAELARTIEQAIHTSDEERRQRAARYADEGRDGEGSGGGS